MPLHTLLLIIIISAITSTGSLAKKRETIVGPVFAKVINVYDGDTIEVLAKVWPGHQINVRVRIRGIDAPEMRAKCSEERFAALSARDRLRKFIADQPVRKFIVVPGKLVNVVV